MIGDCDRCDGSGAEPGTESHTCDTCGGQGRVQRVQQTALGQFVQTGACPTCGGRGVVIDDPLQQLPRARAAAGGRDGRGADPGRDHGRPADADCAAAATRASRAGRAATSTSACGSGRTRSFQRDGNDVVSVLNLPFTRAALGTTVTVETLDGEQQVELRAGTQPGDVLVLRGKGVPVLNGRGRGDHRVLVNVMLPQRLTDDQRRLLAEFEAAVAEDTYKPDESFLGRIRSAFSG